MPGIPSTGTVAGAAVVLRRIRVPRVINLDSSSRIRVRSYKCATMIVSKRNVSDSCDIEREKRANYNRLNERVGSAADGDRVKFAARFTNSFRHVRFFRVN